MTNIYINGLSGKMGSSICDLSTNDETISIVNDDIKNADVVIDFSRPDSSLKVLNQCIHYKKPLLIGTTGFNDNQIKVNSIPKIISLLIGSIIGFTSGIIGIGGGIFLSPILFLMKVGSVSYTHLTLPTKA